MMRCFTPDRDTFAVTADDCITVAPLCRQWDPPANDNAAPIVVEARRDGWWIGEVNDVDD